MRATLIRRAVLGLLIGGLVAAILCATMFFITASLDGTRMDETIAYSLLVAVIGGALGCIVGAVVGLGNMRLLSGGLVGLVVSLAIVAFYMSSFRSEAGFMSLLNRSRVIILFTTGPLILTGIITAWTNRKLNADN